MRFAWLERRLMNYDPKTMLMTEMKLLRRPVFFAQQLLGSSVRPHIHEANIHIALGWSTSPSCFIMSKTEQLGLGLFPQGLGY